MDKQSTIVATGTGWEPMFTYRDLEDLTRLSSRTIIRLVGLHQFPKPVKIGRSCRWRRGDITRFMEEQAGGQATAMEKFVN